MISGWHVNVNGCIWKISSVRRIFKSNYLKKIRSLYWLISFGRIRWWKRTRSQLFINVVRVKSYWKSSKSIISNCKKFKKRCKTILRLRELLSQDFISCQMINFCKFFPRQETHMLFRHIWENVLIISTEFSLRMFSNQEK